MTYTSTYALHITKFCYCDGCLSAINHRFSRIIQANFTMDEYDDLTNVANSPNKPNKSKLVVNMHNCHKNPIPDDGA